MDAICDNPDHDAYPLYGVAPHKCFYKIGKKIGQSEILPQSKWPDNFTPDPDIPKDELEKYGACGVYTCPGSCNKKIDTVAKSDEKTETKVNHQPTQGETL